MTFTAAPAPTTTPTGSALVAALENLYAAIQRRHADLPEHVIFVTGSGLDARGVKWGHFRPEGWTKAAPYTTRPGCHGRHRVLVKGRMPEIFIGGERLECGAELTLQTVLHECAHGLAHMRGVKDCNGGRHNKEFVKVAEEMGLTYPHAKADASLGYSAVVLTDATKVEYVRELRELRNAINAHMDTLKRLGILTVGMGGSGTDGGDGYRGIKGVRKGPDRNYLKCECECSPPVVIRMSAKTAASANVKCEDCGERFTPAG